MFTTNNPEETGLLECKQRFNLTKLKVITSALSSLILLCHFVQLLSVYFTSQIIFFYE